MHSRFCKLNFLIAFGAFFATLSLSGGCTNLFSSNSPNNDAPAQIQAKEGYGIITGSVPAANSVSPRTAMPDPDKAKPASFKVFAQNGSSTVPITVDASGNFSVQLSYGTWEITAQGLNSAGKAIYTQTKKVTLSAANSQVDLKFTLGYSTNPDDGDGEISLSVSFPPKSATSSIHAIEYTLSKGESKVVKISEEELAAGAFKIERICEDLGTYTLTINFYGDFGNLVYRIDEKVQVYANLITDTFLEGSAPYVSDGKIVLTQALLDEFVQTTLYVDANSGKDSNSGTQFDPLKTFNRAVEMVNNASGSLANAEFRIYLKTNVADGAFLELKEGKKLTVASADGTARTIDSLERQFDVAATSELTVSDIKFQKMSFRVAGTLEMNACEISGNTKNEQGGAIHVASGGEVTITNSKLLNNEASNSGGAVFVEGGTLKIEGSTLSGNKATGDSSGGAVFVHENGTFEIKDSEITGNEAKQSAGGGIFVKESTFTMSGCTVRGNTGAYGGGVHVLDSTSTMSGNIVSGNTAVTNGGGVFVVGGTLTMESGEITGNAATNNGGGVYVDNNALFKMQGGTITENKIEYSGAINASTTASYNGGGVYISASGEFTMSGGTISKNTATYSGAIADVYTVFNGGGVRVDGGKFTMSGGEISGNKASVSGGGVSVDGGTFTLSGGAEISANTTNGDGGGVHISVGTFEMTGGTISGNEATNTSTAQDAWASGGGVFVYDGSFTMRGGEISENKAKSSGGGVYVTDSGAFEMQAGTISGNTANGGGGVAVNIDGELTISGGTVSGNHAEYAGGVCIDNGSTFTMSGGEISGNEATSNAGGVFVQKETTFTMEAGTISNNTSTNHAGGVYVDVDDSTFTMKRGTISGNTSNLGGGVYIIGDPSTGKYGTFTMENGTISGNTANTDGGGVYVENAVFTMENGTITENEAKGDFSVMFGGGGGVYIVNTMSTSSLPTFTMKDGVVSKNKANMGGGIYALSSSEFVMSGGKFSENHAAQQGSGAYINNTSTFKMSGAAKFEEDDDVYLYGEVTTPAKITVTGTLTATSPVATITPSSYEDGREILTAGAGITKEQMQAICRQFALTPEPLPDGATEYTATRWGISPASTDYTKGVLSKVLNELYVSENGSDTNLGTKESPLKTMEKAIEMLKEYNDGASEYTIYVHGTITPGTTAGAAMADISGFTEPLNLTIQPFPEDSQATLNADKKGRVVNAAGNGELNLTLENLVLRNGKASDNGGGAYLENGTFTLENCEITGSEAGYGGGGVFVEEPATLTMTDCKVDGNEAQYGGGIYIDEAEATLTMEGGTVSTNNATDGGGIYVAAGTLTMESDATVSENTASSNGGGVVVRTEGTVTMGDTVKISGNTSEYGGGVYIGADSIFIMEDGEISNNESTYSGGGVYIGAGTLTIKAGTISGNDAIRGGGVYITGFGGGFIMENGTISKNNATSYEGGGVYISANCMFSMSGGTVSGNSAGTSSKGGGVYLGGGTFTMKEGTISSNKANSGGGVYLEDGTFTMSGGEITTNNSSITYGGGVCVNDGTFTLQGGTISGNKASSGGGIRIYKGEVTIEGSSSKITGNTAIYDGGGLLISNAATVTMKGGEISSNKADDGAGILIYNSNATFAMQDGTVSENYAYKSGGGIYIRSGTVSMTGGTITENQADGTSGNAGGVYVDGTFNMNGGTISKNIANADGGGVYVPSGTAQIFTMGTGGTITENKANYGGGIYTKGSSNEISGTISNNTANNSGGGVYVNATTLTMNGGEITGNTANSTNAEEGGGGVYVFCEPGKVGGEFAMTGGTISGNKVASKGAGVYVKPDAKFKMQGASKVAQDNDVYLHVYDEPGSIPTITVTGTLSAASPVATITPASYVAGRQVLAGSGITLTQDICDQFALSNGDYKIEPGDVGGVTYGVIRMQIGDTVYLNSSTGADTNSGFKASEAVATLTKAIELCDKYDAEKIMFCSYYTLPASEQNLLDRSSKSHLTFMRYDGSSDVTSAFATTLLTISSDNLVVTISNITIDGNKENCAATSDLLSIEANNAQITLGENSYLQNNGYRAVRLVKTARLTLSGGTITGNENTSTNDAGAIYVGSDAEFVMQSGTISENSTNTKGGAIYVDGKFTMEDGEISGNSTINGKTGTGDGGGVYVDGGNFEMNGGKISGNKTVSQTQGGGVYVCNDGEFSMSGGEISENTAILGGGGVCVIGGMFTMSDTAKICKNISNNAAGVYIKNGKFFMQGGEISEHIAYNGSGGGVYLYEGAMFTMTDGTIKGNKATSANFGGGGVYFDGVAFTMDGGEISGNTADSGNGGDVYVYSGEFNKTDGIIEDLYIK